MFKGLFGLEGVTRRASQEEISNGQSYEVKGLPVLRGIFSSLPPREQRESNPENSILRGVTSPSPVIEREERDHNRPGVLRGIFSSLPPREQRESNPSNSILRGIFSSSPVEKPFTDGGSDSLFGGAQEILRKKAQGAFTDAVGDLTTPGKLMGKKKDDGANSDNENNEKNKKKEDGFWKKIFRKTKTNVDKVRPVLKLLAATASDPKIKAASTAVLAAGNLADEGIKNGKEEEIIEGHFIDSEGDK